MFEYPCLKACNSVYLVVCLLFLNATFQKKKKSFFFKAVYFVVVLPESISIIVDYVWLCDSSPMPCPAFPAPFQVKRALLIISKLFL